MNLAELAPDYMAWLLIALLAAAAIEDSIRLRINNGTSLAILAGAVVAVFLTGFDIKVWQNVVVMAGLLVVGTLLFATGKMGGGDIKLLAATGLWFDFKGAFAMIMMVLIAGGVLAILLLIARLPPWKDATRKRILILQQGGGIPYGVAIAAGAILSVMLERGWG